MTMNEQNQEKDLSLYDWDFVDPPPNEYICGHCREIFKKPMIIECCGGHFCATCIEKPYGNLYRCPDCHEENIAAILNKRMWKKILEFDVKCPFTSHGCLWTGELQARAAHLNDNCKYIEAKCKYECGEKLEMSELAEHLEYFCPKRPVICLHCDTRGTQEYINGEHANECLEFPVECPNSCGISDTKRKDLENHLLQCQLQVANCDYSYAGCATKLPRKDMSDHNIKNMLLHMALMSSFFSTELKRRDQLIQEVTDKANEQLQQLTMTHIQELEQKDKMIAEFISEIKETTENKCKENEDRFKQQIDKTVEDFERKYKEIKLNMPDTYAPAALDNHNKEKEQKLEQISVLHKSKNDSNTEIWLGKYNDKNVAIKKLSSSSSDPAEILHEAQILSKLTHGNILTLYKTLTTEEPVRMILEYMPNGSLVNYLKKTQTLLLHEQLSICKQVAFGLDYLQQKCCIHRRVRIDNVLVGENLTCKINDFSSAVILNSHDEKYPSAKGFKVRVKWSAPEALNEKHFTLKSDVWSYGILMWQVVMGGQEPYPGRTVDEAAEDIRAGQPMSQPQGCSKNFFSLMMDCWNLEPNTRPTFEALADLLDHVRDSHKYIDVN